MKTGYSYLYEQIRQLPPELGEVALDFDFESAFASLVEKYTLNREQSEAVPNLTFHLMFEEFPRSDFPQKLAADCALTPKAAKELADDIDFAVIAPLHRLLVQRTNYVGELYEDYEELTEDSAPAGIIALARLFSVWFPPPSR